MGLSARCGRCRCECAAATTTHGDVVRNRNNDDPDAVLEGAAMAGLVASLRQLGDLAELGAEVFGNMQEQVMAASARGRRLAVRARKLLEADLDLPPPSTHEQRCLSSAGAHLRVRGVVGGEGGTPPMPRLIVQRIRRCRGPPRLSLLDKFDAAGEGACLKRYTDPSFFRAHSAKLELRARANGPYLLKPMETSRPKFQTTLNSEPPESAHTVTDCKSETETETAPSPGFLSMLLLRSETETETAPSPGFLSMLRQLKQHHRQSEAAGSGSPFRMQQTAAAHRVESSPQQLDMEVEQKLHGGGGGGSATAQPSPSELERTSSFEAWLPPDARRFPTATPSPHHHHWHDEIITQEPTDDGAATSNAEAALSSSAMLTARHNSASDAETMGPCNKVKGASRNKSWSRCKGSIDIIASRVSSLPRKLFRNIKHHSRSADRAGSSLRISQDTGIGDCNPELEAIPAPREASLPILVHSDPVYSRSTHSLLLPENDKCYSYLQLQHHESISVDAERHHQQEDPSTDQCSDSNSSTPETCAAPDSKNLQSPEILALKRAGALPPENSSSEDAKVDTTPPLPPIPPMQWLSENVHNGTRAASTKHRTLWKKSLEVGRADRSNDAFYFEGMSNDALNSVRNQVAEKIQAISQATSVSNANVSRRDESKCSEETTHPQPFRVQEDVLQASSEGFVLKAGVFPVPAAAVLSDEACSEIDLRTQAQANTVASDDSSNLQNESVFFSAVQELAKMSPPPSVPRLKYSLLDAGSHGRITLLNGPSPIHPSRNILDSRSALAQQIKDIAMAGNPSFKLKPVSGASSPVTGSPTNSKVATILQRADDIRQAHADSNDVDSEESWSNESE